MLCFFLVSFVVFFHTPICSAKATRRCERSTMQPLRRSARVEEVVFRPQSTAELFDSVRAQRSAACRQALFIFSIYWESGGGGVGGGGTALSVSRRLPADGANKLRAAEGRLCRKQRRFRTRFWSLFVHFFYWTSHDHVT